MGTATETHRQLGAILIKAILDSDCYHAGLLVVVVQALRHIKLLGRKRRAV